MDERAAPLTTEVFDPLAGGSNLPVLSTRIVGRSEIIALVARDVLEARLVSVVGAGGIGKTTVALAVAEKAIEAFADGVWLVDFAPLKEAALVPNAIAAATGLVVHSANVMNALCRFLRGRRMLLVLDNCEHMVEAVAPCVAQILEETGGTHVLTTSRAPLRIAEERVHRLPGLLVPSEHSVVTAADTRRFPAMELFVERAADRLEAFTVDDADAPIVADICRSLDGIALAIELAAMRVDVFGLRGLQRQLDDRLRALGVRRAGLERHRTLAATLDWSFGLLPAREASLLCAVSVFAGVFNVDNASAIAGLPTDETAALLAELASQSLLESRDGMYRPLETTRAYCLEKLIARDADATVRLRHAEYICAISQRAAREHASRPAREWAGTYGRYLDDLRAALTWVSEAGQSSLVVRLTTGGTVLWNHFSLTDESRTHLARATKHLVEAGVAGTAVEMNLQLALASAILYTHGVMPEARAAMGRALAIAVERKDAEGHLQCLRMIGTYQLFSGENEEGLRTLETFVSLATAVDPSAVAEGETHLGCAELFMGRFVDARRRLERLYAQGLQDLNDGKSLRFFYNNSINVMIVLAHAQWQTGAVDAASLTSTMLVDYGKKAEHELSFCIGLAWVCLVDFWAGRDDDCRRHSAMLDDLVERHGIVTWRPIATFCRGALASKDAATRAEGIADLTRTVAACRAMGHLARLPFYMAVLAEALTEDARLDEATSMIDEAVALATKQNDHGSLAEVLRIQAFVLGARGDTKAREAALLRSIAFAENQGALSWRLRAAIDLARVLHADARSAEAERVLRPAFDAFTEGFGSRDLTTAAALLDHLRVG